ncbi:MULTISPECIES: polysaccharide biosynthesis/export family protein [unclassified Lentimonas]|uniref:polysaccharide biosynthesis/export family protein n=1 Tax=unclassified Lentimonas TaxID=2630993 RepID=UPI001323535C|nr:MULTISPECIES: polysaccharide biosynthesis/export family protein [unclassified Lentimonas]CAA6696236.1 Unannotated [Lentimonas sp. CC10]CAA6697505.1 Unannotated [Lentimonas sp. CC19]CAA7071236.1 Unannotated [Lentimonas sp. CC11]
MKAILSIATLLLLLSLQLLQAANSSTDTKHTAYLLTPFDKVTISVYGEPDLKSQQRISDQGTVSIPLLGELKIGDLSVSDAQKQIESSFTSERYLVKPVVTINVEEFAPKLITVVGEVNNPGSIEIPPGQNSLPIQIAIAEAGGFTGAAQKNAVRVTRATTEKDKQDSKHEVDVSSILDGKNDAIFLAHPNDIIFIDRRLF